MSRTFIFYSTLLWPLGKNRFLSCHVHRVLYSGGHNYVQNGPEDLIYITYLICPWYLGQGHLCFFMWDMATWHHWLQMNGWEMTVKSWETILMLQSVVRAHLVAAPSWHTGTDTDKGAWTGPLEDSPDRPQKNPAHFIGMHLCMNIPRPCILSTYLKVWCS